MVGRLKVYVVNVCGQSSDYCFRIQLYSGFVYIKQRILIEILVCEYNFAYLFQICNPFPGRMGYLL